MKDERFTRVEFKDLFPGYASEDVRQRDYEAFRQIIEQIDRTRLQELSAQEKAEIFRHAWHRSFPQKSGWSLLNFWRRPAVTFVLGLALGCVVMFVCLRPKPQISQAAQPDPILTVEDLGFTQTYGGKALQGLYPHIENPKLIVEKTPQDSAPRRVLYGTLDDGKVYVVWNL